jgi:hypothetical protein
LCLQEVITNITISSNPEIADVSALLYRFTDTWINYFKALPVEVALMDDWEKKLHAIAEVSIPQNVTNISGVPTWMLLLFRTVLAKTGKKMYCRSLAQFRVGYSWRC